MKVTVLRNFSYSTTGRDNHSAVAGKEVDIPDHLVDGLVKERYVAVSKRPVVAKAPPSQKVVTPPEKQANEAAPEVKAEVPPAE